MVYIPTQNKPFFTNTVWPRHSYELYWFVADAPRVPSSPQWPCAPLCVLSAAAPRLHPEQQRGAARRQAGALWDQGPPVLLPAHCEDLIRRSVTDRHTIQNTPQCRLMNSHCLPETLMAYWSKIGPQDIMNFLSLLEWVEHESRTNSLHVGLFTPTELLVKLGTCPITPNLCSRCFLCHQQEKTCSLLCNGITVNLRGYLHVLFFFPPSRTCIIQFRYIGKRSIGR